MCYVPFGKICPNWFSVRSDGSSRHYNDFVDMYSSMNLFLFHSPITLNTNHKQAVCMSHRMDKCVAGTLQKIASFSCELFLQLS